MLQLDALQPMTRPLSDWSIYGSHWDGDCLTVDTAGKTYLLESPAMELPAATLVVASLSLTVTAEVRLQFGVQSVRNGKWVAYRLFDAIGSERLAVTARIPVAGRYCLVLAQVSRRPGSTLTLSELNIEIARPELPSTGAPAGKIDTYLPHWGRFKRAMHQLCRNSRYINGAVAAIELRLGREELLSLPQYMSLCPTGQCNALCAFCSVTINRTGIIKKQLSLELLNRFIAPVAKTVNMFGLEGNGEPTLHSQFEGFVHRLTAGKAELYLITNASRIRPERVPLLMALESINVSLNACTADTHRKVMKLKNFDEVIAAIKEIIRCRGTADGAQSPKNPRVSVSFVVTHENIHETQDFLRFAEYELGVDVVLLRPLSELGNDVGTVEDLRDIVPFESDVADLIEAVAEYRQDLNRTTEIRFAPETFRSVRPDPVGRVLPQRGYEDRLLAPRRTDWTFDGPGEIAWLLASATLRVQPGTLWSSIPISVEPGRELWFRARVAVETGALALCLRDEDGRTLETREFASPGLPEDVAVKITTGSSEAVVIEWSTRDGASAQIDFLRVRRPAPLIGDEFRLPKSVRWERVMPQVSLAWVGACMRIAWDGAAGLYLVKSYTIPCRRDRRVEIPLGVIVTAGRLGIGVLNADFTSWISTETFDAERSPDRLVFDTGKNDRVQLVVYSALPEPLRAEISWRGLAAGERTPPLDLPNRSAAPPVTAPAGEPAAAAAGWLRIELDALRDRFRRLRSRSAARVSPRPRVYCHKPWTDLHNFTVDGRMDVCCIATGASQKKYQFGNLNTQSFQEVWNGSVAREFRRTVNSDAPLPPCARCPMAYAYQGLWFDPIFTETGLLSIIHRFPGGRTLGAWLRGPLRLVLRHGVFRGFKMPSGGGWQ